MRKNLANSSFQSFPTQKDKILDKTLSPYLYNNDLMFGFLKKIQRLVSMMFDNVNIVKNFKNYNVDKYYYKHKN